MEMRNDLSDACQGEYTVAILSDIHGNLPALEAVLDDLVAQQYHDIVVAGDLARDGPYPAATLARVRALGVPTIYGNTERDIVMARPGGGIVWWTRERIGDEGVAYIDALPFADRITPPNGHSPDDDLLVVHSTPRSVYDVLILAPQPLGTTFTTVTPEDKAAAMLDAAHADLIVYGHIHYASTGVIRGQRLASVSSVGFPFDGDTRAAYALASWSGQQWRLAHRRVSYDLTATIYGLATSGQPFAERYIQRLRRADWVPLS